MIFRLSIITLLLCCLTACIELTPQEPQMFGIPQSQWNQLNVEQQNQVIAGYNHREAMREANLPVTSAIDVAQQLIQQANDN